MIKSIFERYYLSKWLKENPEPVWKKGEVVKRDMDDKTVEKRKLEYKQWSINHSNWVRALKYYLNIKSVY